MENDEYIVTLDQVFSKPVHPGTVLRFALNTQKKTARDFAVACAIPLGTAEAILHGAAEVDVNVVQCAGEIMGPAWSLLKASKVTHDFYRANGRRPSAETLKYLVDMQFHSQAAVAYGVASG
jgi:hypothetical protein